MTRKQLEQYCATLQMFIPAESRSHAEIIARRIIAGIPEYTILDNLEVVNEENN